MELIKNIVGAFAFLFAAWLVSALFLSLDAQADEYGHYCEHKNGVERCFIWQWDSSQQKLISKRIVRSVNGVKK